MRKSTSLSIFMVLLIVSLIIYVIIRSIFSFKGDVLKNISYKSKNLIIQDLVRHTSSGLKILVVLGNGWNVSVDTNNKITEHDPFFLTPRDEANILKENKNYDIITAYFPFECDGLNQSGIELVNYINKKYKNYKVIMIGHSKSGVCFANACKWLKVTVKDSLVITVSSSYGGVKSDKENLEKLTTGFSKWLYPKIIVSHRTNDDITKNSKFLKEVADFSGLESRSFYNIRSKLPRKTYKPMELLFRWLDNKFEIAGDGIVGYDEQTSPILNCKEFSIEATHQSSMQIAIKLLKKEGIL